MKMDLRREAIACRPPTMRHSGATRGRPQTYPARATGAAAAPHPDLVYTVDLDVQKSRDGGATWETLEGPGPVDQHAFWIDPTDPNVIYSESQHGNVRRTNVATGEQVRAYAARARRPWRRSNPTLRARRLLPGVQTAAAPECADDVEPPQTIERIEAT
jgi:hypothetical protein